MAQPPTGSNGTTPLNTATPIVRTAAEAPSKTLPTTPGWARYIPPPPPGAPEPEPWAAAGKQLIQFYRTTTTNPPPVLQPGEPAVEINANETRLWIGDGVANRLLLSSNPNDNPIGGVGGKGVDPGYAVVASTPPNANAPTVSPPMGLLFADTSQPDPTTEYLQITGGTMTGALSIAPTGSSANFSLNKPVGTYANHINAYCNNIFRWQINLGDSSPESGSNTGSDFSIVRYSDTGLPLGTPFTITRSNGFVTIAQQTQMNGSLTITPATAGYPAISLNNTVANNTRYIQSLTSGSPRWQLVIGNSAAETGSNVGSDFLINRFNDAGAYLDTPLTITRSSGVVTIGTLTVTGNEVVNGSATWLAASHAGTYIVWSSPYVILQMQSGWYLRWSSASGELYWIGANAGHFQLDDGGGNAFLVGAFTNNGAITTRGNSLSMTGVNPQIYMTANGVRQWRFLSHNDGNFYLTDISSGPHAFYVTGGNGNVIFPQSITVSGNFNTNGISGSSLYISGGSTQVGTISCNAINCATLNTQGNALYAGPISVGTITCTSINTQGNQINCGTVSCGYLTTNGNQADVWGVVTHANGINYQNFMNKWEAAAYNALTNHTCYINNGAIGTYYMQASDARMKRNVRPSQADALADIKRLILYEFDQDEPSEAEVPPHHVSMGLTAQQVETILPEAISRAPRRIIAGRALDAYTEDEVMLTIQDNKILMRCVGAIQQLLARIETLEAAR